MPALSFLVCRFCSQYNRTIGNGRTVYCQREDFNARTLEAQLDLGRGFTIRPQIAMDILDGGYKMAIAVADYSIYKTVHFWYAHTSHNMFYICLPLFWELT